MEIKLNKDLQKCTDNYFMGLGARQTFFGGLGLVLSVGMYFVAIKELGVNQQAASWLCILVGAPFAALGFATYNGMPFEKLVKVWLKHYWFCPKRLVYRLENDFYNADKPKIEKMAEKEMKRID